MSRTYIKKLVETKVVYKIKCDCCGIETENDDGSWYHFGHFHNEWGNNSSDSLESFDVCSPKCYLERVKKSLEELRPFKESAEIDGISFDFCEKLVEYIETKREST